MLGKALRGRRAWFRLVNCQPALPESSWQRLPLFEAPAWREVLASSAGRGEELSALKGRPELEEMYGNIAAQVFHGKISALCLYFVLRASYVPQLKALELTCLDGRGLFRKYVSVSALVPVTYYDLNIRFAWRSRFIEEADVEMLYKDSCVNEFFLFVRGGEWNAETANHPELDFRRHFEEEKWFERQHFGDVGR